MIVNCSCKNAFQDALYGKGRRVANQCKNKIDYRCTICGNVHQIGNKPLAKEAKKDEKKK